MGELKVARALSWTVMLLVGALLVVSCSSPPRSTSGGAGQGTEQAVSLSDVSPIARISMDPQGNVSVGSTIQFSAKGSEPGLDEQDAYEIRYLWAFGDGSMASGKSVSHQYASAGGYTVSLSVEVVDASMGFSRDTARAAVTITESAGPLAVRIVSPADGEERRTLEEIPFAVDGATAQGARLDDLGDLVVVWEFGDGVGRDEARRVSYLYPTPGVHTATVYVSGVDPTTGERLEAQAERDVMVLNRTPRPVISVVPADRASTIVVGEPVDLLASESTDPEGQPLFVAWDTSGDGVIDLAMSDRLDQRLEQGFSSAGARQVTAYMVDEHMLATGAEPVMRTVSVHVVRADSAGTVEGPVFSGSRLGLGNLVVWSGQVGGAFLDGGVIASVGYGKSERPVTIPMTDWLPAVAAEGYQVSAYVDTASLVSMSAMGRLFGQVYAGASLGVLTCDGEYRTSTRVTIGGADGPIAFTVQRTLLGLHVGYRVGRFGVVTLGVLLPL